MRNITCSEIFKEVQLKKSPLRNKKTVAILLYKMLLGEFGMFQPVKQRLKKYVIAFSKYKAKTQSHQWE